MGMGDEVTQMDWEAAVVMIGDAFDVRRELVMGAGGFLEVYDESGLNALVQAVSNHACGLWLDRREGYLLEQRCRELADARVGWSEDEFADRDRLQFSWDAVADDESVAAGLLSFDGWLRDRSCGLRLLSIETRADFFCSILHPADTIAALIEALGQAHVAAAVQSEATWV